MRLHRLAGMMVLCLAAGLAAVPAAGAEAPIRVLTASATSSAPGSTSVAALLDPAREGSWRPQALDSGEDEGLFMQFEKPVPIDRIEVKAKGATSLGYRCGLEFYLDGQMRQAAEDTEEDASGWYYVAQDDVGNDLVFRLEMVERNAVVSSIFVKIDRWPTGKTPELVSIRLYREGRNEPLPVEVPVVVQGTVNATSTLAPETAYTALNLFDSRLDFAWSTNGRETDGIGQRVKMALASPQTLSGLIVWNGYQRSDTHYAANARPAKLKVALNGEREFTVALKDVTGPQTVRLPRIESDVTEVALTIEGLYRGTAYKDLLISELRLIDGGGKVIILEVPLPARETPSGPLGRMLDRLYEPLMDDIRPNGGYSFSYLYRRLRLRSNGSFVYYCDGLIAEGNWEETKAGARLFGRKYLTNPRASEYLQAVRSGTAVKIFQADVEIYTVAAMSFTEFEKRAKTLLIDRKFNPAVTSNTYVWRCSARPEGQVVVGGNEKELLRGAYDLAVKYEALLLYSPLFVDLVLPTTELV